MLDQEGKTIVLLCQQELKKNTTNNIFIVLQFYSSSVRFCIQFGRCKKTNNVEEITKENRNLERVCREKKDLSESDEDLQSELF